VRTRGQGPFDSHPIQFAFATTFALPLEERAFAAVSEGASGVSNPGARMAANLAGGRASSSVVVAKRRRVSLVSARLLRSVLGKSATLRGGLLPAIVGRELLPPVSSRGMEGVRTRPDAHQAPPGPR
jgi:hypothetical protein